MPYEENNALYEPWFHCTFVRAPLVSIGSIFQDSYQLTFNDTSSIEVQFEGGTLDPDYTTTCKLPFYQTTYGYQYLNIDLR